MLTDDERWFFDHHGFLILHNVVPEEDIELMIELGNRWHALELSELPPPLTSTSKNSSHSPTIAHWINNVQYGDEVFQRLVLNTEIMRVIIALTRANPCLVDCALTKNLTTSDDINFHASGQDYGIENGMPYAGFINAGTSLVNVPEGTGFVCLPGSHKRNYDPPDDLSIYDGPPTVINVPVNAGDCVIFTEALFHGARRWTETYPRFSVFNRYIDNGSHGGLPKEEYRDLISDEVYELEQPAVQGRQKQVVKRILHELRNISMKTIVSVLLSAIASFLLTGHAYTRTIVTDGLVSYWTFDRKDMTDTTVMDVWGNNNGTIVGAPKSVAGRVGQALEFDGANDYVNLTNLGDFGKKVGSSTFEAWVKTEFKEDWTSLFKVLDAGCNMAWAIDVNRSAQAGFLYAQDVVHFYVRQKSDAGCNHIAAQIDFPLSDGEWHHIVFAVEDAGIPKVNIYMDGIEQIVIFGDASKLTTFEPFVEPVYIGAANNRGAVERFFPGVIDEVRIYDRPLSANEVTRNYESRIGLNVDPLQKLTISWGKIKTDF